MNVLNYARGVVAIREWKIRHTTAYVDCIIRLREVLSIYSVRFLRFMYKFLHHFVGCLWHPQHFHNFALNIYVQDDSVLFGVHRVRFSIFSCLHLVSTIQGLFWLCCCHPDCIVFACACVLQPHNVYIYILYFPIWFCCCADNCRLAEISHSLTVFQSVYKVFDFSSIRKSQSFIQLSHYFTERRDIYFRKKANILWILMANNNEKSGVNMQEKQTIRLQNRGKSNILLDVAEVDYRCPIGFYFPLVAIHICSA